MATPSCETGNRKEAFLNGYKKITVQRSGIMTRPYPKHTARLETETDLALLFPLINGTVIGARYLDAPERIQFLFEGVTCTLYPFEIIAGAFNDRDHATAFAARHHLI
jgi:hypothetical protein